MADQPVKINRIYVECSHTASTGLNTGIQRVVRKIIEQWGGKLPDGTPVHLLCFDGEQCYEIDHLPDLRYQRQKPQEKTLPDVNWRLPLANALTRMQRLRVALADKIAWAPLRKLLVAPREQWGLARVVYLFFTKPVRWSKAKLFPPVQPAMPISFHKDDVLLMLDSSWHYPISKLTAAAQAAGTPIITVTYDLIPIVHPELCEVSLEDIFAGWVAEAARVSVGFIAISQTVRDDVRKHIHGLGISAPPPYFGFFHLGAEISNVEGGVRPSLADNVNQDNSYLIVCTIEPRKNHQYLYETFQKLWAENKDVNLHIVGRVGWKVDALLKSIRHHPEYQKRIFLWHDLNDRELVYCYQNAKALLFPSIVEGFGLPIIEAQHYGLPVLASDTPIHREIGQDSVEYFDIAAPMALYQKLKAVEELTDKLPMSNPDVLSNYTWQASANQLAAEVCRINALVRG